MLYHLQQLVQGSDLTTGIVGVGALLNYHLQLFELEALLRN